MNKPTKHWQIRAKKFADYVKDDYNKDRHILATLGSAGYTFNEDVDMLLNALNHIGEDKIAEMVKEC